MSFQLAALAGRAHDPIDIWNLIFQQGINKLVYDEGLFLLWFIIKTLPGAPLVMIWLFIALRNLFWMRI